MRDDPRQAPATFLDCPVCVITGAATGIGAACARRFAQAGWAVAIGNFDDGTRAAALGLSYGPQAALYAEMFPAKVRYSGVSVGYALGAILGGAFASTIAQWLITQFGQSWTIGAYLAALAVVSLITVSLVKETTRTDPELL